MTTPSPTKWLRMNAKLRDGYTIQTDFDLSCTLPIVAGQVFRRKLNAKAAERMTQVDLSSITSEVIEQ